MNTDNKDTGAPERTSCGDPAIIPSVNSPEHIVRTSKVVALKMPSILAHATVAISASFKTAVKGGTNLAASQDLVKHMQEASETVLSEDIVEVARGGREKENPKNFY